MASLVNSFWGADSGQSWDVANLTANQDLLITETGNTPKGIYFKPDGTEMYFNMDATQKVYQYSLSTPWDISTATATGSITLTYAVFHGSISMNPDGTELFVIVDNYTRIRMWTLSTAWDITTATYTEQYINATYIEHGLYFKQDGTSYYVSDYGTDVIARFDCSTAWDVTTSSLNGSLDVSTNTTTPIDLSFKPDGTRMFIIDTGTTEYIHQYELSTAWDITTATFTKSFSTLNDNNVQGIFIKEDGTKLYYSGNQNTKIYEMDWT